MTSISNEITSMQNQTAYNNMGVSKTTDDNDSNMFLTLMLQQLQNQDPDYGIGKHPLDRS